MNKESSMDSHFLCFTLHKNDQEAFIKPGEITSISPAPEGGSRVVTRQKQIYYVVESVRDVESMIRIFFKKMNGEF